MNKQIIKIGKDQDVWFTGCTHWGHKNIAGPAISNWSSGYREFDSVHEMNRAITDGINKYVKQGDFLFHLGDWSFGGHDHVPGYRQLLIVEDVHIILGNHDTKDFDDKYGKYFSSVQDKLELELIYYYMDQKRTVRTVLGHYPELSWLGSGKGSWMLHSHTHNAKVVRELNTQCKRFETSMDHAKWLFGEYRPFSLSELVKLQDKKDIGRFDHH